MIGDRARETRTINNLLLFNKQQLDNEGDNNVDNHDE
jgi:hypothetical protein